MSEPEARAAAIVAVSALRYGSDDYFWINDFRPHMVMHPFKPELNGKDLSEYRDPRGKRLFVELVETARRGGAGFVEYLWPKPGVGAPVRKLSYVKSFEPWGWIVGSGVYVDDVDALYEAQVAVDLAVLGVVSLAFALVVWRISRSILRPLGAEPAVVADIANRVADGNLEIAIEGGGGEASVRSAMARMVSRLAQSSPRRSPSSRRSRTRRTSSRSTRRTAELAQEVAAASAEQSAGVAQVSRAMGVVDEVTQRSASAAEELSSTAEEMASQAEALQRLMGFFKVGGAGESGSRGAVAVPSQEWPPRRAPEPPPDELGRRGAA